MPRKISGNALTKIVRVHPNSSIDLKFLSDKIGLPPDRRKQGHVVAQLILMFKAKKIGHSPFLEERQSPSLNPRLNEGAIENDEEIYKNLYEESLKCNANYVKRVEKLCKMLGISYVEGMKLEIDAPIQR